MSTTSTPLAAPTIPHPVFLGLLWSGTGLSLSFVIFRLIVKIRSYKKVYSDDYLVVAAWILLLGSAVLWQFISPNLYDLFAVTSGEKPLTPDFISENADFLRSITPFSLLFYSCLWTVKLSFLLFFRRLGLNVKGQKIWWWCVLTITVLTWIATVADHDYKCSLRPLTWIWVHCQSPSAIRFTNNTYYGNCAADVVTDCLIISIPVRMLWNVRLPLRQKLLLMTIFSLTVIVMVVSIIRVAIVGSSTRSSTQQPDISWVYFWSNIEMSTAIVIACIGSFRQIKLVQQIIPLASLPKLEYKIATEEISEKQQRPGFISRLEESNTYCTFAKYSYRSPYICRCKQFQTGGLLNASPAIQARPISIC
ncbi:MAG: hypothetical protein L6R36_003984 [Xanthoria steineri]|nr:MAG: hypothetical protein L6R36_003984 [Xanthoria steineri]